MTDREELDAVEAEHGALTNEYFELKQHFAGDATPQWVVDRVEAITPRRDELFDLQWELRKKLNLDPRTGQPKVKSAPTKTVDEGWFPELLGPICETSKCKYETDEKSVRTLDKAIVHECCDSCSYHLIRYIVDGKAVAGLSLRANKPWRGKQSAVIDSVFTSPHHRRHGYASKIMEYAREHFREVKHSKQLTTMGKAWKKAVKNPPDNEDIKQALRSTKSAGRGRSELLCKAIDLGILTKIKDSFGVTAMLPLLGCGIQGCVLSSDKQGVVVKITQGEDEHTNAMIIMKQQEKERSEGRLGAFRSGFATILGVVKPMKVSAFDSVCAVIREEVDVTYEVKKLRSGSDIDEILDYVMSDTLETDEQYEEAIAELDKREPTIANAVYAFWKATGSKIIDINLNNIGFRMFEKVNGVVTGKKGQPVMYDIGIADRRTDDDYDTNPPRQAVKNSPIDTNETYSINGAGARDGKYKFVTDCVGSTFEDIRDMIDRPENFSISRETFRRRIGQAAWEDIQATLGYDRSFPISKDWHVSYGESVYRDVPCVFLKHSGIEHIYTLNGEVGPSKGEE